MLLPWSSSPSEKKLPVRSLLLPGGKGGSISHPVRGSFLPPFSYLRRSQRRNSRWVFLPPWWVDPATERPTFETHRRDGMASTDEERTRNVATVVSRSWIGASFGDIRGRLAFRRRGRRIQRVLRRLRGEERDTATDETDCKCEKKKMVDQRMDEEKADRCFRTDVLGIERRSCTHGRAKTVG